MRGFDPLKSFGPRVAEHYDDRPRGDEDDAVAFLARLAGSEPALEFAVGTGRIAVPLAERGIRVDGIELSEAMIERLRAKQGAEAVGVVQGDMATASTGSRYGLVFLVYNTIFNLVTQEDQVLCFQNAAAHLGDGGRFVVEAALPGPLYTMSAQYVDAEAVEVDRVVLDVGRYDRITQILDESHVSISADGIRLTPLVTRFVWPAELDLMARIAGLRLVERWGGWRGEPCTNDSPRHVSVYARQRWQRRCTRGRSSEVLGAAARPTCNSSSDERRQAVADHGSYADRVDGVPSAGRRCTCSSSSSRSSRPGFSSSASST